MKVVYRNNIVHRMGGEFGFDFLVLTYCENILDDECLERFFGNFDLKALTFFQKELLLISFLEPCEENYARRKRVKFRHELMGLDKTHFLILEKHFVEALDDCFITGLDYELCKAYFAELHSVFKEVTKFSKYKENIVERMGGEKTFDFLIVSYCERIEYDERLFRFFGSFTLHSLTLLQRDLIMMVFLQPNTENKIDVVKRRVTLKFAPIFALGLNETHFEVLEEHFTSALYECSSKPNVIQGCKRLFASLLPFFQANTTSVLEEIDDEDDDYLCEDDVSDSDDSECDYDCENYDSEENDIDSSIVLEHPSNTLQLRDTNTTSHVPERPRLGKDSSCSLSDTSSKTEETSSHESTIQPPATRRSFSFGRRPKSTPKLLFSWRSSFKKKKHRVSKR